MQPLDRMKQSFPWSSDAHTRKGMVNWWDSRSTPSKMSARQQANMQIVIDVATEVG